MRQIIKRNTFSILIFIHRGKKNKYGQHPIYCRLTVQGTSKEFSTQLWIEDKKWNVDASKVIGNSEASKSANYTLYTIKTSLFNIRASLQEQGKLITSIIVINTHLGKTGTKYTLIDIHRYYNEKHIKPLLNKDYSDGTYERYKTSLEHTKRFLKFKYGSDDIAMEELNLAFATGYEFYLKTERDCSHNTTLKYIKNLKAVINFGVKQGWIIANPLNTFSGKLERVDKTFLTEDELNLIEKKKLSNERLNEVKDVFIFCCYTGLSYSDVAKLSCEDIYIGINGKKQISINRTKTDVNARIPLLDKASDILAKYKEHPMCICDNRLLPVKSNQKQNEYLKEIATLCNINKHLTTHTARHTFATLMMTKKVSMESVSKMLGHTNLKTTQIYAKIVAEKVNDEMDLVNNSLNDRLKIAK
jgi:site-specific recombinase XerD